MKTTFITETYFIETYLGKNNLEESGYKLKNKTFDYYAQFATDDIHTLAVIDIRDENIYNQLASKYTEAIERATAILTEYYMVNGTNTNRTSRTAELGTFKSSQSQSASDYRYETAYEKAKTLMANVGLYYYNITEEDIEYLQTEFDWTIADNIPKFVKAFDGSNELSPEEFYVKPDGTIGFNKEAEGERLDNLENTVALQGTEISQLQTTQAEIIDTIDNLEDEIIIIGSEVDNLFSIVSSLGEKRLIANTTPNFVLEEGTTRNKVLWNVTTNEFDPDITYLNGDFTNNSADPITLYLPIDIQVTNSNTAISKVLNIALVNETTTTDIATTSINISSTVSTNLIAKVVIPAGETIAIYYQTPSAVGTLTAISGNLTMTGGVSVLIKLENYYTKEEIELLLENKVESIIDTTTLLSSVENTNGVLRITRINKSNGIGRRLTINSTSILSQQTIDNGVTWTTSSISNEADITTKNYVDTTIILGKSKGVFK